MAGKQTQDLSRVTDYYEEGAEIDTAKIQEVCCVPIFQQKIYHFLCAICSFLIQS